MYRWDGLTNWTTAHVTRIQQLHDEATHPFIPYRQQRGFHQIHSAHGMKCATSKIRIVAGRCQHSHVLSFLAPNKFLINVEYKNETSEHTFFHLLHLVHHLATVHLPDNGVHMLGKWRKTQSRRNRKRCTVLFTHSCYYIRFNPSSPHKKFISHSVQTCYV
jgi:hypothetical protein